MVEDLVGGWTTGGRFYEINCCHGVGHPIRELVNRDVDMVHGCDGCCSKKTFEKAKEKYLEKTGYNE